MSLEFLWYIPNTVEPGHRGDDTKDGWGTLDFSTRPRPRGRGPRLGRCADRYWLGPARHLHRCRVPGGAHPYVQAARGNPAGLLTSNSSGANRSPASPNESNVSSHWPTRSDVRTHPSSTGYGSRPWCATPTEEAWRDTEAKVSLMANQQGVRSDGLRRQAVGQQRLLSVAEQGEVLDSCLYTTPGKYGGGGAGTTWLVGPAEAHDHAREAGRPTRPLPPVSHA
jgi:hypothetical protein